MNSHFMSYLIEMLAWSFSLMPAPIILDHDPQGLMYSCVHVPSLFVTTPDRTQQIALQIEHHACQCGISCELYAIYKQSANKDILLAMMTTATLDHYLTIMVTTACQ